MKTLINKNNPQIRITAPEIGTGTHGYYYVDSVGYHKDKWTLVVEEPTEGIRGNLEEIPSNVSIDEEPEKQTSEYFKKPDYDKQVVKKMSEELAKIITDQIVEPMDLEKAAVEYQLKTRGRLNVMGGDAVLSKEEYMKFNSNKDFIAGARWMAEQMKGGSK